MQTQIFSTQVKANRKSIKPLPFSLKQRLNLIAGFTVFVACAVGSNHFCAGRSYLAVIKCVKGMQKPSGVERCFLHSCPSENQ